MKDLQDMVPIGVSHVKQVSMSEYVLVNAENVNDDYKTTEDRCFIPYIFSNEI